MDDPLSPNDQANPWTAVDDGQGNTYYHNLLTGESSWEKPPEYIKIESESESVAEDETSKDGEWKSFKDDNSLQEKCIDLLRKYLI